MPVGRNYADNARSYRPNVGENRQDTRQDNIRDNILHRILDRLDHLERQSHPSVSGRRTASDARSHQGLRTGPSDTNTYRRPAEARHEPYRSAYTGSRPYRQPSSTYADEAPPPSTSSNPNDRRPAEVRNGRYRPTDTNNERRPGEIRQRPYQSANSGSRPYRQPPSTYADETPPPTMSTNPDFALLVRATAGLCQIDQHTRNWDTMPDSISQRVDNIIENIRPPRPNGNLVTSLQEAATIFKDDVTSIVKAHLYTTREEITANLHELNPDDFDLASGIAGRQLRTRLGNRLHLPTFRASIEAAEHITCQMNLRSAEQPTQTRETPTQNRFSALPVEEIEEADTAALPTDEVGETGDVQPTTSPTRTTLHLNTGKGKQPAPRTTSSFPVRSLRSTRTLAPNYSNLDFPPLNESTTADTASKATNKTSSSSTRSTTTAKSPTAKTSASGATSLFTAPIGSTIATRSSVAAAKPPPSSLRAKLTGHSPEAKDSWTTHEPRPHQRFQLIGDSNLCTWGGVPLPPTFNIDSFSGCRLADVTDVLDRSLALLSNVDDIVLAVGINDRNTTSDSILSALQSIDQWRVNHSKRILFSSVPIFRNLSSKQLDNIEFINTTARDIFGDAYVTCCDQTQVELRDGESKTNGIHYTLQTADIIVVNLMDFLDL